MSETSPDSNKVLPFQTGTEKEPSGRGGDGGGDSTDVGQLLRRIEAQEKKSDHLLYMGIGATAFVMIALALGYLRLEEKLDSINSNITDIKVMIGKMEVGYEHLKNQNLPIPPSHPAYRTPETAAPKAE